MRGKLGRGVGDRGIEGMLVLPEIAPDSLHVRAGFRIRGNASVTFDGPFAGVVRSGDQRDVTHEIGEQPAQIGEPATDVLRRIERLLDVEPRRRLGYQLHQALRVPGRTRVRIEVGLGANDGERELRADAVLGGELAHEIGCLLLLGRRRDEHRLRLPRQRSRPPAAASDRACIRAGRRRTDRQRRASSARTRGPGPPRCRRRAMPFGCHAACRVRWRTSSRD